jgi:outer membrane lipoprotein-sorting protein
MKSFSRVLPAALLLLLCAASVAAQSADDIIAKNLQTKGGLEKWKSIQSMKLTGHIVANGQPVPLTIWSKRPNLMRQEIDLQGTRRVQAFDGTTAWMMNGDMARGVTGPEAQAAREQADFDSPFIDYRAKGNTVEFVGNETIDGASVAHIKLTRKTGQVEDYYFEPDTGLERRTSVTLERNGQKATVVSDLSDYRDVGGVKVPFSVKQSVNGTPLTQLTVDNVEFNVPMDAAMFRMPKQGG